MNRQFVMYLINIINYQTLCPNPYSRLGCGMILKSASAFEDDNDEGRDISKNLSHYIDGTLCGTEVKMKHHNDGKDSFTN